jgi:transketolase
MDSHKSNRWSTTQELAWRIRKNALRMTHLGGSSHIGSVFSIADILAVLYGDVLNVDPENPDKEDRDRFILSKGHAGAGLYATLAECGFFSLETLDQHYQNGSVFSGHVSHKGIPGVEFSTGSLGHGLPVGCGMALSGKLKGAGHRIVVQLSDGECDEGSNWEAFLFAAHFKLDNLLAIIDYNKLQSIKSISETMGLEPFVGKLEHFGWNVIELDGHDHEAVKAACSTEAIVKDKPTVILANTVKGKGVSFMENNVLWHYRSAQGKEYEAALAELEAGRPE